MSFASLLWWSSHFLTPLHFGQAGYFRYTGDEADPAYRYGRASERPPVKQSTKFHATVLRRIHCLKVFPLCGLAEAGAILAQAEMGVRRTGRPDGRASGAFEIGLLA